MYSFARQIGKAMSTLALFTAIASSTVDAQQGANDCQKTAFSNYLKSSLALSQKEILLSVQTEIAMRRLEEQFCLSFVQCQFPEGSFLEGSTHINAVAFAAMFSRCLEDEARQRLQDSGGKIR